MFRESLSFFFGLNPLRWKDSVSGYVDSRNSGNQFLAWAFFEAIECGEATKTSSKIQPPRSKAADMTRLQRNKCFHGFLPCPRLETVEKQIKAIGLKTDDDSLQEAGRGSDWPCGYLTGHQPDFLTHIACKGFTWYVDHRLSFSHFMIGAPSMMAESAVVLMTSHLFWWVHHFRLCAQKWHQHFYGWPSRGRQFSSRFYPQNPIACWSHVRHICPSFCLKDPKGGSWCG